MPNCDCGEEIPPGWSKCRGCGKAVHAKKDNLNKVNRKLTGKNNEDEE